MMVTHEFYMWGWLALFLLGSIGFFILLHEIRGNREDLRDEINAERRERRAEMQADRKERRDYERAERERRIRTHRG